MSQQNWRLFLASLNNNEQTCLSFSWNVNFEELVGPEVIQHYPLQKDAHPMRNFRKKALYLIHLWQGFNRTATFTLVELRFKHILCAGGQ